MRAVLTYHSIDASGSPVSVHPEAFARHVAFLAGGRVKVVPFESLPQVPEGEEAVALTFDDGFLNLAEFAWPLLRDAGLPATVFAVTEHVGGTNRWGGIDEPGIPALPLMDWDTLARVASEGLAIGSHTCSHARLPGLDDPSLAHELHASRELLEARTGAAVRTFAYPYGDHDARTVEAARAVYDAACTTELSWLRPEDSDPLRLPRLDAYYLQAPGRLDAFGTPAFRRYVGGRALLRRVRRLARRALTGGHA